MFRWAILLNSWAFLPAVVAAQADTELLALDEYGITEHATEDPLPMLSSYDRLNRRLGGDSIRLCNGRPCEGWVEDRYPDGTLMHRGSYAGGRLVVYRNYYPNGVLERDFRELDEVKCVLRTYHPNSTLRSDARYADGQLFRYIDHYPTGQLRYAEERHRREPYFTRMDLFAPTGKPISLLRQVARKPVEFEQQEFHPDGSLRCSGRARYNTHRMDTQRVGLWTYYDRAGNKVREEEYIDGKVHAVR